MPFVDTNVILYAACPGSIERIKAQISREILRLSRCPPLIQTLRLAVENHRA